jgi:predicted ester cyclase
MTADQKVSRHWLDAVNSHEPAQVRAVLHPGFVWELGTSSTTSAESSVEAWRMWFIGFPDFRFDLLRLIGESGIIVLQLRMRGTHRGEFRFRGTHSLEKPLVPTQKAFDLPGCAIHEILDSKIARLWAYWDTATLLRQLGVQNA